MMEKKISKTDNEYKVFGDVFRLYIKYGTPERDQEYWNRLNDDCDSILREYNNMTLAKHLILAITDTLREEAKKLPVH